MKNASLIVFALCGLFLAGCAGLQLPTAAPTAASRSTVLTYESRADGAAVDRTRTLVVEIPGDVHYKNNYYRQYVSGYVTALNTKLTRQADIWKYSKEPAAPQNLALYRSEKLKFIRDLDTLAPADVVPQDTFHMVPAENESAAAQNAADDLAEKYVHELLKQERK
jgi:hypothetical protein